ncbi:MAG TPA: N-acetyl-gamma-glutamyl-phosphate reductase [Candidatus Thermoplasmatota archaeon]|nr:N-acetyl-gamma-glutamyl-phosphate reductase [Candidatus Thermoplasmatota archaeon]
MSHGSLRVGIAGASGYLGAELLRILANHPHAEVTAITSTSQVGASLGDVLPQFSGVYDLRFTASEGASFRGVDVVFLATPHGAAAKLVPEIRAANPAAKIIDLSQDHRVGDEGYGAVYGLPELFRGKLQGASLVANPGCYPTASALAVAPLFKYGLAKAATVVVDAKSGVSGAGRDPKANLHYPEMNESLRAYSVGKHRHTPEIAQTYGRLAGAPVPVVFTPHIVPMNRGILAACYVQPQGPLATQEELDALYRKAYATEAWVRVTKEEPDTKHTRNTNFCDVRAYALPEANLYVAFAAIDNLVKGGSGQAVQNMNVLFGLPETAGLPRAGGAP